jgi:hypothetical protein
MFPETPLQTCSLWTWGDQMAHKWITVWQDFVFIVIPEVSNEDIKGRCLQK